MKKLMIVIILMCMLPGFQTVFADGTGTCGKNVKYTIKGNTINFSKAATDKAAIWKTDCRDVFRKDRSITTVNILSPIRVSSGRVMFSGAKYVKTMNLSKLDVSRVRNMVRMFGNCTALESVDVSGWNTSRVTNMNLLFGHCTSLKSVDLSSWDTSRLTSMKSMFKSCTSLKYADLSGWDTSKVTDMGYAFLQCGSLNGLDLSSWDTSNVTEMKNTFAECDSLKVLVLGRNTLKKNIFKKLPDYKTAWYYIARGAEADSPLPLKTVREDGSLFRAYKYRTMAGTWSVKKNPGLAKSISILNMNGKEITGKTITIKTPNYRLGANVLPAKAEQEISWKSSKPGTAVVDAGGLVTFRKAGTVKITAGSMDISRTTAAVTLTYKPK